MLYSNMLSVHPDIKYMQRCIDLALKAGKNTGKNPKVGAVLVYNHHIIGEGFHEVYGGDHAEVNAINNVLPQYKEYIPQSTLYVSLEPCCHTGKTPPCTHRIVREGIKNVVIGSPDPNHVVAGKGIQYLKEHNVRVSFATENTKLSTLIDSFKANLSGMPYVILKWAQSADNFISKKGEQTWLSNDYSRILVHKWRSECDGIMIGKNTALIDNPGLNVRYYTGQNPVRIIMDSNSESIDVVKAISNQNTWIVNKNYDSISDTVSYIKSENLTDLETILKKLFILGISTLLVEGGSELLQGFIKSGVWHEARIIRTKTKLADGISAPLLHGILQNKLQMMDDEILYIRNHQSAENE